MLPPDGSVAGSGTPCDVMRQRKCLTQFDTQLLDIESILVTKPGFRCFRTDRACKSNKRGRGTAIFINQRWCSLPKQPFTYAKDSIEATAVTCRTKLSCKFLSFIICSIYFPPYTCTLQLTASSVHSLHFSRLCLMILLL